MGYYLNLGNAGFSAVLKDVYVDKTEMIKYINGTLGTKRKLTCFSRPRRFGKSYAAQMLCAYYDKSCDSRELFKGLEISKDPCFEEYLNKYNVIYLDITWFIANTNDINNVVANIHSEVINELQEEYPEIERQDTLPKMLASIAMATGYKFIIIIDEWDALFRESKDNTALQEEYILLMRGLFRSSGITDKMIEAAYITGILPIKKYGSQSAVSDFKEYSMLTPKQLAKYVGFTESEVKALCKQYGLDFAEMKRWYDGYSFSRLKSVYSPDSVMEAINSEEFGSYWTRTETYESLKIYIDLDFDGLKEAIVQMLGGAQIKVDVETFQNDMTEIKSRDNVLTLLIHLGYLAYDAGSSSVFIPNEEVRREFIRAMTTGKYTEIAKLIRNSELLLDATLGMDEEAVAAGVEEAHKAISSPLFYNKEDSLRSTIRFAYLTCIDDFTVIDEFPSGIGFIDMAFMPKQGSPMPLILIELKWNKSANAAIQQVKDRDYPHALKDYGGDILLVGINYNEKTKKHTCKIEKYSK